MLFTVRSPYYSLSVVKEYLALGGGPPSFTRPSTGIALLEKHNRRSCHFTYGTITLYGQLSILVPLSHDFVTPDATAATSMCSHNPSYTTPAGLHVQGLGYSAFARRYLRSRDFFPFLQVLRCFSSLRRLARPMDSVVHDQA